MKKVMDPACSHGDQGLCQTKVESEEVGTRCQSCLILLLKNYSSKFAKMRDTVQGHQETPYGPVEFCSDFLRLSGQEI